MSLPTAPRTVAAPLLLIGLLAGAPGGAEAQFRWNVIRIEAPGETREGADLRRGGTSDNPQVSINAEECVSATTVVTQTIMFPTEFTNLDVWRGRGLDCATEGNRNIMTGACEHVETINMDAQAMREVEFPVTELLPCDDTTANGVTYSFAGLATDAAQDRGPVDASAAFELQLDVVGPAAPTGVTAGTGNTQIPVRWDGVGGVQSLFEYRVYGDESGADCEASADTFVPGTSPVATTNANSTSTNVSGAALGLGFGDSVRVAVTAVDRARNEGALSEPVCVTRVETEGFCATHEAEGGECDGCSVGGTPARAVGLSGLALAALAGSMRRRRYT